MWVYGCYHVCPSMCGESMYPTVGKITQLGNVCGSYACICVGVSGAVASCYEEQYMLSLASMSSAVCRGSPRVCLTYTQQYVDADVHSVCAAVHSCMSVPMCLCVCVICI